jgi:diguanylate cyclase (GGDEF)-like protein
VVRNLREELELTKKQLDLLWKRNRELEKLSITDALTGLYNQRHFHDRLEQAVTRSKRQGQPLCLILFDVDGLKTYNDTYGHLVGNDVLKAVARSLLQNIRNNFDSGYRYGGDEFAVILHEAHAEQAAEVAGRVNKSLRKTDFQHVVLSFGIAELSPEMDSEALFRYADDAMYVAKKDRATGFDIPGDKIHIYDKNITSRKSGIVKAEARVQQRIG